MAWRGALVAMGMLWIGVWGFAQEPPVKPAPSQPQVSPQDLAQDQEVIARKYAQLERTLLGIAQKLEKSGASEGMRKAIAIRKALEEAKNQGITLNLNHLADLLRKPSLNDLKKAMDQGKDVTVDMEQLLLSLLSDSEAEQIEFLKNLVKELDIALQMQKTAFAKNVSSNVDKNDAAKAQEAAAARVADLLRRIQEYEARMGQGKQQPGEKQQQGDQKGEPKGPGEQQGDKKGESKPNDEKDKSGQGKETPGGKDDKQGKGGKDNPDNKGNQDDKGRGKEGQQGGKESEAGKSDGKEDQERKGGEQDKDTKGDQKPGDQGQKGEQDKPQDQKGEQGKDQQGGKGQEQKGQQQKGQQQKGQQGGEGGEGGEQQPQQQPQQPQQEDPNAVPGRERIKDANDDQKKAADKINKDRRNDAVPDQEDAARKLEEARKRLEEVLRQKREEEKERILSDLKERCEKLKRMQEIVKENTVQLHKQLLARPDRKPTPEIETASSQQAEEEDRIIVEADKAIVIIETEGSAVVFAEVFRQLRNDMHHVSRRLARPRTDVGEETQLIEQDIINTLQEMIDALKAQIEQNKERKENPPQQQQQNDQLKSLIDLLAELRMVRSLQLRVNNRTTLWGKRYQGELAQQPDIISELRDLSQRQQKIYGMIDNLAKGRNQ